MQGHALTTIQQVREFMTAGNATFTIRSTRTNTRFTYKLTKAEDGNVIFVKLLNGPDNTSDFRFIGTLFPSQVGWFTYRHSAKSNVFATAGSVAAFQWFMRVVTLSSYIPNELEVWHEGRCGRCGRKLTVPESISSGFGPECIGIVRQISLV